MNPFVYEAICQDCKQLVPIKLGSFQRFVKTPDFLEAVEAGTTPGLEDWLVEREEFEASLLRLPQEAPQRIDNFAQLIQSLQYMSEYHLKRSSNQSVTALVQLGLIICLIGSVFALAGYAGGVYAWLWYGATLASVIWCVYRMTISARKSQSSIIEPLLVRSLAPMNPSLAEIEFACERLDDLSLARAIRPQRLLDGIKKENREPITPS